MVEIQLIGKKNWEKHRVKQSEIEEAFFNEPSFVNSDIKHSEKKEREFWLSHDSSDYVTYTKLEKGNFPNLKPSTKTISLRIPEYLLDQIRQLANKQDIPYQSLIKVLLSKKVGEEIRESMKNQLT